MKKILFFISLVSLMFAAPIKNNSYFLGVSYDRMKINSFSNQYSITLGYYFYDPNIYRINNRIYLKESYTAGKNIFSTSANLDWIVRNYSFLSPIVGVNAGYLSNKKGNISTGFWGINLGLNGYINRYVDIDLIGVVKKGFNDKKLKKAIKEVSLGVNFNF